MIDRGEQIVTQVRQFENECMNLNNYIQIISYGFEGTTRVYKDMVDQCLGCTKKSCKLNDGLGH